MPFNNVNDFNWFWYSDSGYSTLVPDPSNVAGTDNTTFYLRVERISDGCTAQADLTVQPCNDQYLLVHPTFQQNQTGANFVEDVAVNNFTAVLTALADFVFVNNSDYNSSNYTFKWYETANDRNSDINQIADNTAIIPFVTGDGIISRTYHFVATNNKTTVNCRIEYKVTIGRYIEQNA